MNILCLDQFGELGGAQRCLLDLLPALAEREWRVHVAAPGEGPLLECAARFGATADPIRCGPYSSGSKTIRDMVRFAADTPQLTNHIRALISRYHADLIYVNGPRLLPAVALALRREPPMLFHAHSFLGGSARLLAGRSLAIAGAAVVASCRFVAAPLRSYIGDRGIRVVYNGVREMPFASRPGDGAEFRIGVIGRIAPEKGQADFVHAARILHRLLPQCGFVICGRPLFADPAAMRYANALKEMSKDLPIEFAGWREDVEEILSTLDLLVVPSSPVDATPRVILEAFAAGVPVLAFASGGIPEMIEPDVTGFLVEQRSAQALASAIGDLVREPSRLREVAERARASARARFSLERYRAEMMEAMEACVDHGRRQQPRVF